MRERESSTCTLLISYYKLCTCVHTYTCRCSHIDDTVFPQALTKNTLLSKQLCSAHDEVGGAKGSWREQWCLH